MKVLGMLSFDPTRSRIAVSILALHMTLGLSSCIELDRPGPQLTALEVQSIQKRDFDVNYAIAFASVLSVFQDLGYIIDDADKDTGFITARSPAEDAGFGWVELFVDDESGDIAITRRTKSTAVIEALTDERTSIRLNFVVGETQSSRQGTATRDEPILEPDIYRNAFDKIEDAIFIREGTG